MANRFKVRTRKGELRPEVEDDSSSLEEWICDKIPPVPEGQKCEHERHMWDEDPEGVASTFMYVIEGDHVCYSYLCDSCGEGYVSDDYLEVENYPTTKDGYAVSPRHCT